MLADLTPKKDGIVDYKMEDDVIRGATVVMDGFIQMAAAPAKAKRKTARAYP